MAAAAAAVNDHMASGAVVAATFESKASRFASLLQQHEQTTLATTSIPSSSFLINTSNTLSAYDILENVRNDIFFLV